MVAALAPVEIFCSYAHEDDAWLHKLEKHLSLLKRQGLISLWHDRLITPGIDWAKTIDTHLEIASVILLLVSADFFASDYCYGVEMKRALERQEAGEAWVIPILVRPSDWRDSPLAHLQALPTDAKPISSWLNKDTALADIAAGIRRVIEDMPLLVASAPRVALPAIWNIPYSRNPFFLGREIELAQLRHYLQAGQATALARPQAISGLGGIGKTQLALEYAYRYYQDYQVVLWVHAESSEALISSYIALASLLRLPEREAKEQDVTVQAVKSWLQTHRAWLLILDNADELTLLPDFLPAIPGGHVLQTTRAAATGRLAHRLEIETLLPEQGALFLLRRATFLAPDAELSQLPPQQQKLALQISQEMGGLPLALDQAGAYLEETGMNLADYWNVYQQHRADLLQRRGKLVVDHPTPVATTWSLSFQRVEEKNPAAADLLRLCAYLAPDTIAEEILTAGASLLGPVLAPVATDAFLLGLAIEALRAYSLVRRDRQKKVLLVHRLIQAVLQDELEETERRYWAEYAILAVNAAFPASEYGNWSQCERLLPQALLAAKWSNIYQINRAEVGHLLQEVASYLQDRARYQEAEPLYQLALRIREEQLGPDHPDVATSLAGLAKLYQEQGKYAEAGLLMQRALAIDEQIFGSEHQRVATDLNNLAELYTNQHEYTKAEPLFQRALAIYEQKLGLGHPHAADTLNNLAAFHALQGNIVKAEQLFQRALAIYERELGLSHPHTAHSLNNLAELYHVQGKIAEAEQLLLRALTIWEQIGPLNPGKATSLSNLAFLWETQSKYAEAEQLYTQALEIYEQHLGPSHPHTKRVRQNYTSLLRRMGRT